MRKKKRRNFIMIMALLAVAVLLMLPIQTLGARREKPPPDYDPPTPTCEAPDLDNDGDGFTNGQECNGLIVDQNPIVNQVFMAFPSCYDANGNRNNLPDKDCLHPDEKDIFVQIVPLGQGSLLPEDLHVLLEYINDRQVDDSGAPTGHLGVWTHLVNDIPRDPDHFLDPAIGLPDRWVIFGQQRALTLTESDEYFDWFGLNKDDRGVPPTGKDNAVIYTYTMKQFIEEHLGQFNDEIRQTKLEPLIIQTAAHELGHGIWLWTTCKASNNGCHEREGYGKIMEAMIKVQGDTFFIPDLFDSSSIEGFEMKVEN